MILMKRVAILILGLLLLAMAAQAYGQGLRAPTLPSIRFFNAATCSSEADSGTWIKI